MERKKIQWIYGWRLLKFDENYDLYIHKVQWTPSRINIKTYRKLHIFSQHGSIEHSTQQQ